MTTEPDHSMRSKVEHALLRGSLVAAGIAVAALALRTLFLDTIGPGGLLRAVGVGIVIGLAVAAKWYWEATGGDVL